jgi:hypothetical protein
MTDVMPEQQPVNLDEFGGSESAGADGLDAVDEQLIARLAGRAREGGLALTGEAPESMALTGSRRLSTRWTSQLSRVCFAPSSGSSS